MRRELKSRLNQLEQRKGDDLALRVDLDGYYFGTDYDEDEWTQVYEDATGLTVFRHKTTGKTRGAFIDRRSKAEIVAAGGDLSYL